MGWRNKITTSIHGRRLGLQELSSSETGATRGQAEVLVGVDEFRQSVTTSESTATNLAAYGLSFITGSSAASSSVFTLDPPIPGVRKLLYFTSTGDKGCYLKTANSETITSLYGSSFTVIKSTMGGFFEMMGLTTAIWGMPGLTSGTSNSTAPLSFATST